jgi:hypothetical protein
MADLQGNKLRQHCPAIANHDTRINSGLLPPISMQQQMNHEAYRQEIRGFDVD